MFEAHVLYLLRQYLGHYVRGLSPEALQISVWKGDVVLKDLQLREEALNALKLPITVKAGFLGSVTLKVPWNKLGKEPVIVLLDRLYVLAEPVEDELLFTKESQEIWLQAKRKHIEELEMSMLDSSAIGGASPESKSWMGSFFSTIIGNLKISVTNLHIRYEDVLSNPGHPFCFGITMAKLAAVTIDENGSETFVTSGALDRLNKSLQLERFSVYHDSDTKPWALEKRWDQLSGKEWNEVFEPSIRAKSVHQYLLHPVDGSFKYHRLGKREIRDPGTPFQRAFLVLKRVELALAESQYRDAIKVLEGVSRYRIRMEFSFYRPLDPVLKDPKAWWKYACQAVLQQQRKTRCKFLWENVLKLCIWRRNYVELYASGLQQGKMDCEELKEMDKELDVEVILLWRLLAHAKVETARLEEAAMAREKARRATNSWFFGWGASGAKDLTTPPPAISAESGSGPGRFTKEEWSKINELVSYQPGQDSPFTTQEGPNMLQAAFNVTLQESEACIKDSTDLVISRGKFSNLNINVKMYPKMIQSDTKLTYYGLSAPEGPLIESVSREGRLHALEVAFVYAPLDEQLDWKLSAVVSPCHVTVWRSSLDRFVKFFQSGQALSPTVATETAVALQIKIEEVARRAQERFQSLQQRRFSVDLDIDAPKIRIPALKSGSIAKEIQLLVDLGHFNLRTVEENEAAKGSRYTRFAVSARDISAFFVDGIFKWSDLPSLDIPTGGSDKRSFEKLSYTIFPVLDRCGMSAMLHQARWELPNTPSLCASIDVPRLGLHFSPARYLRLLYLLQAIEDVQHQPDSSSWKMADYSGEARTLLWGGIGNIRAQWEPCWLALAGSYLYVLESENASTYRRSCSMGGKHVIEIPPEMIGGSENAIAVCYRGHDAQKAVESSGAIVLQLKSEEAKTLWLKYMILATYRSSVPVALLPTEEIEKTPHPVDPHNQLNLYVTGVLKELQISVSGKTGSSTDEIVIAELQALGGEVNLLQRPYDMKIAIKLHSLKMEDKLQGPTAPSCKYIARSVLSAADEKVEERAEDEPELFRDAVQDFNAYTADTPRKHVPSWEPDKMNFVQLWSNMEEVVSKPKAEGEENADFVRMMLIFRQTQSSEYAYIDTQMTMNMATLDFFCNRPTVVAFIDFGTQLGEVVDSEASEAAVSLDEASEEESRRIVTGLLGRGKSRVVFQLKMEMESARIYLNLENGTQLAMLAQDKFHMDLKVYPGSFTVLGNLGNLRVCDMKLGPEHHWGWLCDIRDPSCGSLVQLEFNSFNRDDEDFDGYDYSLVGKMSAVRIVFLYKFVQEVMCYFTALASPQVQQVITVVDTAGGGIERLIQKTDIEGAPALKLDLSLDNPLIVMPRSSTSKDFMEVDLGRLSISNSFEWHGGDRDEASAVHLDVLHADLAAINMAVGIDGKAGKSMIQDAQGLHLIVRRPLRDLFRKVPEVQVDVQVQTLCGRMSDREYLVILDCAATNVAEVPELPPNFRELNSSESDEQENLFKSVQLEDHYQEPQEYFTKVWVLVDVKYAELELHRGIERESALARVEIHDFWLGYRAASTLESDVYLTLPKLSIVDLRPGIKAEMRMMFGSMADVEKAEDSTAAEEAKSVARLTMLVMDVRMKPDSQTIVMRMQRPRLLVVVDFLLEMTQFFMPSLVSFAGEDGDPSTDPLAKMDHIRLARRRYQQQASQVTLSVDRQLIADAYDIDEFVYDGCGNVLTLNIGDDYNGSTQEPLIVVGYGKRLRFMNVRIKNGPRIHQCTQLASDASYSVLADDGVLLEDMDEGATLVVAGEQSNTLSSPPEKQAETVHDFLLDIQIVAPELTFYDSTKWPSSSSRQEKLLRAKLDFNLMLAVKGESSWIRSYVKGLSVENSSGAVVMDPLDISGEYVCAQGKTHILVTTTDIFMRPSCNVVRLVLRLHDDAVEKFKFGSGILYRCTHFDRIWVNKPGTSSLPEVTFWRPKVPPGFVILGDCATSSTTPPSQGVVAVYNTHHRARKPTRYELVWSSTGVAASEEEACCIWLPVAPPGYVAMGCIAERGTSPPPLTSVHCIRADLITSASLADCVLYIPPGDRDYTDGCSIWRVDNTIGSFFACPSTEAPPKTKLCELRQLLLLDLSNLGNEKPDDQIRAARPAKTPTLKAARGSGPKVGRNSMTTPQFERLWWDKGTESRRVVSIWRPVPPPGFTIVGDSIVDGLEPPGIGLVLRDDGSGRLIKPIRFQQRVHICGRGLEDVFIWYPVSPAGYVALGCIVTTTPDPPSLEMVRCVCMDLVGQGNLSKRPVWNYVGSRGGNSCCLWRVENQACTFIARADLKRPPPRMAYFLAESGKPTVRENLTAEMKVGRLSLTIVHDLTGLETPLMNATLSGINLAAHGRADAVNAVALTSIAASTFNAARDAWEPLIEPFDGIVKFESYDGDSEASLKVGRRVRISAANTVNINLTSASLQALLGAWSAWKNQAESEQQALASIRMDETDYKQINIARAALEEDDTEKLVVHNHLFSELYLRTYQSDFENVQVLHEGATCIVPLPPPRFPEKLASAPRLHSRQFVAVHVLEARDLPVSDDGNSPDFLCALRLVTNKQQPEDQKPLPQSARSRCVRPSSYNGRTRASASWNEVFIFEISLQSAANLEVVITNQAAKSGKGQAVGILSIPIKEENSQKVSQPAALWKLVRQSITQDPWPIVQAKAFPLKPPRKRGSNLEKSEECGHINVQLYFFTTGPDWKLAQDEKLHAKDFGLLFSHAPDGPWESLKTVLPVSTITKTLAGQQMAVEVTVDQGRKHATFRSLVFLSNNTDMPLEVAVCPFSLLHTLDAPGPSEGAVQIVEECFENQRYQPLAGWGSKWPGHLIPTDPGRWSTRDYTDSSQDMLKIELPPGWIWTSDWTPDKSGNVDQDGWFYGPDFQSIKAVPLTPRGGKKSPFDFVRRRRWIRIRQRVPDNRKTHRREIVGVVEPGGSLHLPLSATAPQTDYCAQVRPAESNGSYLWARMVDSSLSAAPPPSPSRKQQQQRGRTSVSSSSFTLSQLEKHEQLLLSVVSDQSNSKGHCWLSMETFEHSQAGDWRLSVDAPLRLENLLPCNAEYIIWEKVGDARPVKRQHGIVSEGDWIFIYAADARKQIILTWLPQGGWRPEKEGVIIFDPRMEELPTGFWMSHHASGRRLRVSLEYDFGSSNLAAKIVRLFVPYWLNNEAGLPLAYRLTEIEQDIETPKGGSKRNSVSGAPPNDKPTLHRVVRTFEIIENHTGPIMLSPHAQPERLGLQASSRVEDVLSPRIGLSVAIAGNSIFKYGFGFRELEDNKDHVHFKAFDVNGGYHRLSVSLDMSSERTKIVRLRPHSLFINRLGKRLQLRQARTSEEDFLYPNQDPRTFLWRNVNEPELLELCVEGYRWSRPFSVEAVGTMHIHLVSETGSQNLLIRVEVRSSSKRAFQLVIFRYASSRGPYRIENKSSLAINYRQDGGDSWHLLRQASSVSFAWENLKRPLLLEILVSGADSHTSHKYIIDEPKVYQPLPVVGGPISALQVTVLRGTTALIVSVSDSMSANENSAIVTLGVPARPSAEIPQSVVDVSENQLHTSIELAELGLSIVDDTPEELLYLSVQNFFVSFSTGLGSQISRFKLKVDGLQVDNQLPLTPMPVLFSPQDTAKEADFLLKCTVVMKDNGLSDQQVYPFIGIQGPDVPNVAFLVKIHEPIIWRLHHMLDSLSSMLESTTSETSGVSLDPVICIGLLNTSEIRFKVTLAMSPTQRPRGVLGFWSTLLTSLGNTDDMPVRITSHVHENICMGRSAMVSAAIASVRNDMLSQPLRLLSGVDLLGNASSALGHMSKGVAALSMDKKFIRSRQKQETKTTVEDIGDGIREGGEALAKGFFRGVTGILTKPFEGAKASGVEGFIQGFGKGVIGAAVQPVSGILDLLSKTTEGANATRMKLAAILTSEEQLLRRRLPRVIGGDKILRPYDEYKAQGQILLQLAQRGTLFGPVDIFKIRGKFASDAYEDHFNLPKARTLIITHRRVVLLQHPTGLLIQKKPDLLKNPCTISWDVSWNELELMELTYGKQDSKALPPSRLVLYLNTESMFDTREAVRVVKCHTGTTQAADILASIQRAREAYGPQLSGSQAPRAGSKPYAGSSDSSGTAMGLLTGPAAPVSVPILATFGALLGTARQGVLGCEPDAERSSTSTSSTTESKGRFISDFKLVWSNKEIGPHGSEPQIGCIWRPVCPSGYVSLGDVVTDTMKEPTGVMVFPAIEHLTVLPLGYELVWREEGSGEGLHLTIWKPRAPKGYVAVGCVAVADFYEPETGLVACVSAECVSSALLVEPALKRKATPSSAFWTCALWRIANHGSTFLAQRDSLLPPSDQALQVHL